MTVRVVLASGSPRRHELLAQLGMEIDVRPSDIDETPLPGEHPIDYVRRLALGKAEAAAFAAEPDTVVVAADTTVEIDGQILAKPDDAAHAVSMLQALRGRTHHAHTGVAVRRGEHIKSVVVTTAVDFADVSDAEIAWYVGTGEPLDKAGAYAVQGRAAAYVRAVHGSVTNVVGLPLTETLELLKQVGVVLR